MRLALIEFSIKHLSLSVFRDRQFRSEPGLCFLRLSSVEAIFPLTDPAQYGEYTLLSEGKIVWKQ